MDYETQVRALFKHLAENQNLENWNAFQAALLGSLARSYAMMVDHDEMHVKIVEDYKQISNMSCSFWHRLEKMNQEQAAEKATTELLQKFCPRGFND